MLLRLQDRLDGSRSYDSWIQKDSPRLPASMPSCRSVIASDLDDPYQLLVVYWVRQHLCTAASLKELLGSCRLLFSGFRSGQRHLRSMLR